MPTRLRGPPKPRDDDTGTDAPDARTFLTFATMMLVISVVILGIGGVLHGLPTFSGPVGPAGGDTSGATDTPATDGEDQNTGPVFGGDDGDESGGSSETGGSDAAGENGTDP